jgi:erythritol transport system substrate-binding protein
MRFTKKATTALLMALMMVAAACGGDNAADEPLGDDDTEATDAATEDDTEATDDATDEAAAPEGDHEPGVVYIITVDPSNPYWATQVAVAEEEAQALGYETVTNAHLNDPDSQNTFIDAAISAGADALILDPAGAEESVGAVQRALDAGIPSFLVNAELAEQGIAKSQIVSNNAQGATLGAEAFAEAMNYEGTYVELFGNPTDNNAPVRSDAYAAVLDQYPDMELLQQETANWDRVQGKEQMDRLIQAHPNMDGVISGNDEMALGAIEALREAGLLDDVLVLGFDGNDDAAAAVAEGTMVATSLQPIVRATQLAVEQMHNYLMTGETGADSEKQAIDCVLITQENAGNLSGFRLEE